MAKKPSRTGKPEWLTAVNLDVTRAVTGEPIGILGLIDENERQTDYLIGRNDAEIIIRSLRNFIDIAEGRPISFPMPAGKG